MLLGYQPGNKMVKLSKSRNQGRIHEQFQSAKQTGFRSLVQLRSLTAMILQLRLSLSYIISATCLTDKVNSPLSALHCINSTADADFSPECYCTMRGK